MLKFQKGEGTYYFIIGAKAPVRADQFSFFCACLELISMSGDDSVATNSLPAEDCNCVCSLYFLLVLKT